MSTKLTSDEVADILHTLIENLSTPKLQEVETRLGELENPNATEHQVLTSVRIVLKSRSTN